jgi:hypothetical protein
MLHAVTTLPPNTALRRETGIEPCGHVAKDVRRLAATWRVLMAIGWSVAKRLACGLQIVDLLRDTVAAEIEAFFE